MEEKKNLLTYAGLKALEDELHDLKLRLRQLREIFFSSHDVLLHSSGQ